MNSVYIQRIATVLPHAGVENDRMEKVIGQVNGRPSRARSIVLRSNGIKNRHYALDPATGRQTHTNAQLTADAVRALGTDGFSMDRIELLACGTSSPDQLMPSHAVMVHGELGGGPMEVMAAAGVCCSGINALKYAYLAVRTGDKRCAVATGSELSSTFMTANRFRRESASAEEVEKHPEIVFNNDFLRWMLSDGAGAMLLGPEPAAGALSLRIDWIELFSYAHEQSACMFVGAEKQPDGRLKGWREFDSHQQAVERNVFNVTQDVKQLNENIARLTVEKPLPEVLRRHPMGADDIHWFVPHFSSEYFRPRMEKALAVAGLPIPQARWHTNLSAVGNVGSASIYLALDSLVRSGRLERGQKVLCFVPESGRFSAAYMLLTAA